MPDLSRRTMLRLGVAGAALPAAVGATAGWRTRADADARTGAATDSPARRAKSGPALTGAARQRNTARPSSWVTKPFDNNEVVLTDSIFTEHRARVQKFLHDYPLDNMLFLFRQNAGLNNPPGARAPGGWEVEGGNLRGHYAGHFLSGLALAYAGTGDSALRGRVDEMVRVLGECQRALDATVGDPAQYATIEWTAQGRVGGALTLDGASTYVQVPDDVLSGLDACTFATWVRPAQISEWARVFDFGSTTQSYLFLTLAADTGRPRFAITTSGAGGEQQVDASSAVSPGEWTHVAVTLDGHTATLYVNGEVAGTHATTLTPSALAAAKGNWLGKSRYGDPYFAGTVDDFRIYGSALDAGQIHNLATASAPADGAVVWYDFDDGSGNQARDASGHGHDATVYAGILKPAGPSHAGYLAAYPESQFVELEKYATYPTVWAPWYTCHMIMRGLLDAHQYTGNRQALHIAAQLGDWAWSRLRNCTRPQLDRIWHTYIAGEYNAMPVALTDLYAYTGKRQYLEAAQKFVNTYLFDDAVANRDTLDGEHANQHIPQYLGYLTMYERFENGVEPSYRGPARNYLTAARNFWDMVVPHRIYVDGGMAGSGEIFGARDVIASTIQDANAETCCEYNMLKLGRSLFLHTGDAKYLQYYERALFGQLLASREDVDSGTDPELTYFIPVKPGAVREYGNLGTCCGGTGLETHAKFQDSIYFSSVDDESLYVNLYIPSRLRWTAKGVLVEQTTDIPHDPAGRVRLQVAGDATFALALRVPYWADGGLAVTVNGEPAALPAAKRGFVSLARHWRDGDTVEITMPYSMRSEAALDQPETQALAYGPVPMVTIDDSTDYLDVSLYGRLHLDGDLRDALDPTDDPMVFRSAQGVVRPLFVNDESAYHVYFHRSEATIVFAGTSSGVPNVADAQGRTFLDHVWAQAPFADRTAFVKAVRNATMTFTSSGLLTDTQARQVLAAAKKARLGH